MNSETLVAAKTKIIDGRKHSDAILAEIKTTTRTLTQKWNRAPGLATILIGDNPASHVYVNLKRKKARALGFEDFHQSFPVTITETELIDCIHRFNENNAIDGILVQMPLPEAINTENVIRALDPVKDVDGFHVANIGSLFRAYTQDVLAPCTPVGIMELLRREHIALAGQHVVIMGRSNLVSKPLATMLLQSRNKNLLGGNAAVTVIHSGITDLEHYTTQADILVVAIGRPRFITQSMVKRHAIIIDVGINKLADGSLVGDVHFNDVLPKVHKITPVPGGVGPMTIAALMQNTLKIFQKRLANS